jgi:hypothetical protein
MYVIVKHPQDRCETVNLKVVEWPVFSTIPCLHFDTTAAIFTKISKK